MGWFGTTATNLFTDFFRLVEVDLPHLWSLRLGLFCIDPTIGPHLGVDLRLECFIGDGDAQSIERGVFFERRRTCQKQHGPTQGLTRILVLPLETNQLVFL